ncbi:MAG: efflux RND transporter permease subunit, partial [Bacteroidota bacterium]|nr:efflux RND transporter permease subunit [Bacteroidota bacterium]
VNNVLNSAFAGKTSGQVFEGEKRFDLVVKLQGSDRNSLSDIQNLLVPAPNGTQVPLYQLADVSIENGPYQIQREDSHRRIIVGFNVKGRDVQSIVAELQQKVSAELHLPVGYYITYGGEFENLVAAKKRLSVAVPASLIMIFILLFFALNSAKQAILIYTAIPLSAIGGIFFLAVRGLPFSISAGVGFIALFGVAVLNGIVLIAEFHRQKQSGYTNVYHSIMAGAKLRLRPVLMTATVASLGFLPMALSSSAGAEVQRPLATVVIGGLLTATFLTLFVLPVLYAWAEGRRKTAKQIPAKALSVFVFMLLATVVGVKAQTPVHLQEAIDSALKNNLTIKSEQLKAVYQKKLVKTSVVIPSTNVTAEMGHINSAYTDNRFGVLQSISFPTVYSAQKKVNEEEVQIALLGVALQEQQVKRAVAQVFYTILIQREKEKLLQKADSNYVRFLDKATLRFKAGESNILEKTTAETQRGNIQLQLKAVRQQIEISKAQLQLLLNTSTDFEPVSDDIVMGSPLLSDSTILVQHPLIKLYEQQRKVAQAATKLERSRLLPDLHAAYYNMTMKGVGADNKTYSASDRFQSFQFGIGIPLFYGSQRAKINAVKVNEQIAATNVDIQLKDVQTQYRSMFAQYQNGLQAVRYFRDTALQNADTILQTANLQFVNGEINYLDWVVLTNGAFTIQTNYLDNVQLLNESIISINYLLSNNTK